MVSFILISAKGSYKWYDDIPFTPQRRRK